MHKVKISYLPICRIILTGGCHALDKDKKAHVSGLVCGKVRIRRKITDLLREKDRLNLSFTSHFQLT